MEGSCDNTDLLISSDSYLTEKYQFIAKIGEGCFGKIFKVKKRGRNEISVLKVQCINTKENRRSPLLTQMHILKKIIGKKGVPNLRASGRWQYGYYLEIQLLQCSLYDEKHKQYSLYDINCMAKQLIQILKTLHEQNIIHQDLKPQNIMRDFNGDLVVIDYGLSHIKSGAKERPSGFIGTPRYASIAAHKRKSQNKKDDIESLLYVLAFMYLKKLPWLKINAPQERKLDQIYYLKETASRDMFRSISHGLYLAYDYVRGLKSGEQLDYEILSSFISWKKRNITTMEGGKQTPKNRKNTDIGCAFEGFPIIMLNETPNQCQEEKKNHEIQNYSEMAQDGYIEILQVITEKFLPFCFTKETVQSNSEISHNLSFSQDVFPQDMEKYGTGIQFKNPFTNPSF